MQARDIMTSPVITAGPNSTIEDIAGILLDRKISAVPIVDETGQALGLVSEADLMRRPELGTSWERPWWLRIMSSTEDLAWDYMKARGQLASEVMTPEVLGVDPFAPLATVVRKMERERVKRVLVTEDGKLLGIITRADLVRAMMAGRLQVETNDRDRAIRTALLAELDRQPWWLVPDQNVTVADGVVSFWGDLGSEEARQAAHLAARKIPGVRRIVDDAMAEEVS
jgi:CBS domain-containing protein